MANRSARQAAIKTCALSLYTAYWALVLPFLCWGAWATPGHPHLHPHFVFSQPLTEESMHGDHAAASREQHHATSGDDQDVIAGESTPSIGALSMLALVVTSLSQQTFLLPVGCEYAPPVQFPPGLLVHVATPPPRCAPL